MSSTVTEQVLDQAVTILQHGGLIAFPTESWYGLAVDAFNEKAIDRLYSVKRRASAKPILILASGARQLDQLVESIPVPYAVLMEKFWPGPLSLVFPAHCRVPERLTAGTGTVAVRCSSNPVATKLVARFGRPITATSANISGTAPHATASGVSSAFAGEIDMILDGGKTPGRHGSTIIGYRQREVICLREGQIPFSLVEDAVKNTIAF